MAVCAICVTAGMTFMNWR